MITAKSQPFSEKEPCRTADRPDEETAETCPANHNAA